MSEIISLSDYTLDDKRKLEYGLEKLDDALSYFDEMKTFAGNNLAALTYVAIRYAEQVMEESMDAEKDD